MRSRVEGEGGEKFIQKYGMRLILSQPAKTPSDDMRQTLGRIPLE